VKWIFAQRLAGHSLARLARALNETGIPCPSAADPQRNPHRSKQAWTLGAVRTILANPRYTGRQVWNRQPSAYDLIDPANTGFGHWHTHRRIQPDGWVISARPAHAAVVSEADFIAAQDIRAPRGNPHRIAATGWPGSCVAGYVGGGWNHAGRITGPPTDADMDTPAPRHPTRPDRRTFTSAKTASCPTYPPVHAPDRNGTGA
jgi:hypothetical protein